MMATKRTPPAPARNAAPVTLTLRLPRDTWRRLRRYVATEEDKTSTRVYQQDVVLAALANHLDKVGG